VQWNLNNKTAVITGGTKGIGLAIANEFLSLGAKVIVIARDEEEIGEKIAAWKLQGYQVQGIAADLTQFDKYDILLDQFGANKIDVLVNNAGGNLPKRFLDYTQEDIQNILNLNLISVIRLTQSLFGHLKAAKGASVINISSIAGFEDVGTGSLYAICKAALIQLTKSLAVEWAPHSIRVNSVAPWFTSTGRINTLLEDKTLQDFVLSNTPLNRIAKPKDVASAVTYLAMDASSYITGETITVDGGFRANSHH